MPSGAFGRRPFFDAFVDESLTAAFDLFAAKTGRQHAPLSRYRMDDASIVLVALGAAIETARAAADRLRKQHKLRVGVLGVHSLRPFPGALLADALKNREQVLILERADAPLSGEPPLTREIRAAMSSAPIACSPVVYGVGGLPLRVADLVALCKSEATLRPATSASASMTRRAISRNVPCCSTHCVARTRHWRAAVFEPVRLNRQIAAPGLTIAIRRTGEHRS